MLDSGATALSFIDSSFVRKHHVPTLPLPVPRRLRVVDGRDSAAGEVTHKVLVPTYINDHYELLQAFVTDLGQHDLILGKPWLDVHNPFVDWPSNRVEFNSTHCHRHCFTTNATPHIVRGIAGYARAVSDSAPTPSTLSPPPPPSAGVDHIVRLPRRVGAAAFDLLSRQGDVEIFSASLYEISQLLDAATPPSLPRHPSDSSSPHHRAAQLYLAGVSLADVEIALHDKPLIDPATKLPSHYHDFLPVFDRKAADQLPPHRDCDHKIELLPGEKAPAGPLYNMSHDELRVLRKWLTDNLEKGFIRASSSPAASPVLFAKKPGGGLRFCVDYRALNAITIKNRYPLPLIQETLAQLSKAKYYTKLDVISAFNKIRMAPGQEWMTAFNTRYGLFESMVMPFGLSNAPATFQSRINEILHPYLDVFCTAYIDDVLVYSDTLEQHRSHVKCVLAALQEAGLQLDIGKCEFETTQVTYLGLVISDQGVQMDSSKVSCILDWHTPQDLKDVQGFLGFANFYRRFIKDFSRLVKPLVNLTRKGARFSWSPACQTAFAKLKHSFSTAPLLRHFDPDKEIFVETDASDFVSSGILSQRGSDDDLHPVAFLSKKHNPAECNYEIYDKELLAIVRCFESWRAELQGAAYPITVLTDHRNLVYFMSTKQLSRRQVRWSELLSQFNFEIRYRPGKDGKQPDSLTRRRQDLPTEDTDPRLEWQSQTLLPPHLFRDLTPPTLSDLVASPADLLAEDEESTELRLTRLLEDLYPADPFFNRISKELHKESGVPRSREISLSECLLAHNRLYYRDRLYAPVGPTTTPDDLGPLRTLLLQQAHDSCEAGHPGKNKLYEILSRDYFWPHLHRDCERFCRNCHTCIRNNTSRLRYQGSLKPLPLPAQRWRDISVDFVGPCVRSNGFDCIMVVVDRLSKERHLIPCHTSMSALDLAKLFLRNVWKYHGLPDTIVSDRGSLFVSNLWDAVCHRLRIKAQLSTSFHPETDGQTEITNAFMEQFLRKYVDFSQGDWEEWLPMAEFSANNLASSSTGISPFFANKGYHPRMSFGPPRLTSRTQSNNQPRLDGDAFASKMESIMEVLRSNLLAAQAAHEHQANRTRNPAPAYRAGDLVFLDRRNITTDRPMQKLEQRFLGPFQVTQAVNSHAYRLNLPPEMSRLHNVFHTNLLRLAPTDPVPGQSQQPAPPVSLDFDGAKLWAIDSILDSRRTGARRLFQYRIRWRDYDPSHDTWEPLFHVFHCRAATADFHSRFPAKPKPSSRELASAQTKARFPA